MAIASLLAKGFRTCGLLWGQGYRLYFVLRDEGLELVILLAGGGDKSTQSQDIKTALQLARELKGVK